MHQVSATLLIAIRFLSRDLEGDAVGGKYEVDTCMEQHERTSSLFDAERNPSQQVVLSMAQDEIIKDA